MTGKLEVSFNSPQCGWMSIGFDDGSSEFHTTTAHAPHANALPELMQILSSLMNENSAQNEYVLRWNRNPEEFDFRFVRDNKQLTLEIYQYRPKTVFVTSAKWYSRIAEASEMSAKHLPKPLTSFTKTATPMNLNSTGDNPSPIKNSKNLRKH